MTHPAASDDPPCAHPTARVTFTLGRYQRTLCLECRAVPLAKRARLETDMRPDGATLRAMGIEPELEQDDPRAPLL